jgi:hypothetical protein
MQWLDAILLDSRFGVRMLVKHPALSVVAAFALAVGIAVAAAAQFPPFQRREQVCRPFSRQ